MSHGVPLVIVGPRRAELVSVRELRQWRSTPVGRAGID